MSAAQYAVIACVGFVIGIITAGIGLGGGIFMEQAMVIGFGLNHHLAQGTSLGAILPTASVGFKLGSRP